MRSPDWRSEIQRLEALVARAGARALAAPLGFRPLPFTVLYVDPQDSTGHASNDNPGTLTRPILTTGEVNRRFLLRNLIGDTAVNYLSEDLGGEGLNFSLSSLGPFNLIVNMTPVVVHTGGQLDAGTVAINPLALGGGQRQTAHTTDLGDFGPFVLGVFGGTATIPVRLVDTVTGFGVWLAAGAGSATASCTRPTDATVSATGPITIGNDYVLRRPGLLPLAAAAQPASDGGALMFNDCAFPASSLGPELLTSFTVAPTVLTHCASLGPQVFGGELNDCYLASGMQGNWIASLLAGLLIPNIFTDVQTGSLSMTGDVYITAINMTVGGGFYEDIFIPSGAFGLPGAHTGIQLQDCPLSGDIAAISLYAGSTFNVAGLIWGNGNPDVGMLIRPGATFSSQVVPSVTGTNGDFAMQNGSAGQVQVARAWDDAAGAYTEAGGPATRATTWANLVASLGAGGFHNQAHDVAGNGLVTIVGF